MRNDYVFSIAIHIMNGFGNKTEPAKLPCQFYYTLDRDVLYKVNSENDLTFFVEKNQWEDKPEIAIVKEYIRWKVGI